METTLHQQLKIHYGGRADACEIPLGDYRIDVMSGQRVIEVQCSPLGALRDKVRDLCPEYNVTVVKPVIRRRRIINMKWSRVIKERWSPHRGEWWDFFDEMVHFTNAFPIEGLTLEVLLVDVQERRRPPKKGRSRRGYRVEDRELLSICGVKILRSAEDLLQLLPVELPEEFTTKEIADQLEVDRSSAQRVAYCLRECGAVVKSGKVGNAILYKRPCQNSTDKAA